MQRAAGLALVAAFAVQGGGGFDAGARAYAEGRFADAALAFAGECTARGAAAPGELWFDLAQAAFAAGDLEQAERAVATALRAAPAGGELARHCAFAQGSIAWQRGAAAAVLALQVEAEPFAFAAAQRLVAAAQQHWQVAATGATDWPAAARNAERALRRLDELRTERERIEAERRRRAGAEARPMLLPNGDPGPDGQGGGGAATDVADNPLAPLRTELSAAAVAELFVRLQQKEQQKRDLRRAERERARTPGENDW